MGDIDAPNAPTGVTPLMRACEKGHEAAAVLLLDRGARIDARDANNGDTALMYALEGGHERVAELLIAREPRRRR
jgi:ankyrin repeat protein